MIEYLLKQKHNIEIALLKSNKKFDELLINDQLTNRKIMVELNDVIDILQNEEYEDDIYGFLNYQLDLKYDIMLKKNYTIINKNINIDKLNDNYGIIELFEKKNGVIISNEQYYLLKGGNINYINNTDYLEISDKVSNEFIITQIYRMNKKPVLIAEMSKEDFFIDNNEIYKKYEKLVKNRCIDNDRMITRLLDFENIYRIRNLINNENNYNFEDVLEFNFSNYLNVIKIINKYDIEDYKNLIKKYFDYSIDKLYDKIKIKYEIQDKMDNIMIIVLEILIRMYIDIKLGNETYSISKEMICYIPKKEESNMYGQLKTQILKDRHMKNLLINMNIKQIILEIFELLKTNNMDKLIRYLISL